MRFPEFLKEGDTIGITAPSFGCTTEPYDKLLVSACSTLKEKGFKIITGDTVYKNDGLGMSTDPRVAATELINFIKDDSLNAIISAGGGEMMCETISNISFEELSQQKPKWFMGYSDNTNFIFPYVTLSDTAAIYGPCISGLGVEWKQSEQDAFDLLTGKKLSFDGYKTFEIPSDKGFDDVITVGDHAKVLTIYNFEHGECKKLGEDDSIEFSGTMIGGCLDVIENLTGTGFDNIRHFLNKYSDKGIVWVLESCDHNPMDIRRALWHLKECGWFYGASGFVIGRPYSAFGRSMMGVNAHNAVTDILKDCRVPVILDADVGHIDPAMPLIMGSYATVKAKQNDLNITMDISSVN